MLDSFTTKLDFGSLGSRRVVVVLIQNGDDHFDNISLVDVMFSISSDDLSRMEPLHILKDLTTSAKHKLITEYLAL